MVAPAGSTGGAGGTELGMTGAAGTAGATGTVGATGTAGTAGGVGCAKTEEVPRPRRPATAHLQDQFVSLFITFAPSV